MSSSPCRTANQPSGSAPHARQAADSRSSSAAVGDLCGHGLVGQRGPGDPVGPEPGPPGPVGRRRVAPDTGRGRHVVEAGSVGPREQSPAGVRLGAVAAGDRAVDLEPSGQARALRVPGHGRVVGVAHRDQAARPGHPRHLAERSHRVDEVLQHLVGVHHVERRVREVERVDVARRRTTGSSGRARRPRSAPRSSGCAERSRPTTRPGATRSARSAVIVPGPQPTSSSARPGARCGRRYAAEFSADRQVCERSTLS